MTNDEVEALKARINGRRVIASVSGGKDSAAMSLFLTELGIEHDRVFCDTGWEHPATYEYLRGPLTEKLGPIVELQPVRKMEELILHKGIFPGSVRRFCTQELKVAPLQEYMNKRVDAGEDVLNAVGVRAQESANRAKMPEWEWTSGFDCEVWRPMIRWTEDQVIDIHHRHGLRPNPLYLKGFSRVGCFPCIFARKDEIRLIAETTPERIEQIRNLENLVALKVSAATEKSGRAPRKYMPTWFEPRLGGVDRNWTIDKVVSWSKTSRGGRQLEMFAAGPRDAGCMRWGLCETMNPAGDASSDGPQDAVTAGDTTAGGKG